MLGWCRGAAKFSSRLAVKKKENGLFLHLNSLRIERHSSCPEITLKAPLETPFIFEKVRGTYRSSNIPRSTTVSFGRIHHPVISSRDDEH